MILGFVGDDDEDDSLVFLWWLLDVVFVGFDLLSIALVGDELLVFEDFFSPSAGFLLEGDVTLVFFVGELSPLLVGLLTAAGSFSLLGFVVSVATCFCCCCC